MRIAWLTPYPVNRLAEHLRFERTPSWSHPCSWIVSLSDALAERTDIDLHLVTESSLVAEEQTVHKCGITFHVVPTGLPIVHRSFPRWCPLDLLTAFRRNRRRLVRTIRRIAPDLVHGHGTEAAYGLAALDSGYPFLISIQGVITEYFKTNPSFRFRVVRRWEQDQVRRGHNFACRTNFDTGFVKSINPQARIFPIHEAMNPAFFEEHWRLQDTTGILFVGSLEPRKGLAHLLLTIAEVKQKYPTVQLQVVGGGSEEHVRYFRTKVEELGLTESVVFHGPKTAPEIARFHRTAQVFVLPSQNENSPNTLAEAMVSGMPVIATSVGGIPSMVQDGETGLLVPWSQPHLLAEKIIWLLQHPKERVRLGENARRIARGRHQPSIVAEQTVTAYREILGQISLPENQ